MDKSIRFDKRMITISRADYMSTKVNLLPFVTDGALMDMTVTTDALIRELRAIVADHPPKSGMVQQQSDTKANLGFSDEQLSQALKAIEQDDDTTLKAIVDAKLKECPEIRNVLTAASQSHRMGRVSNPLLLDVEATNKHTASDHRLAFAYILNRCQDPSSGRLARSMRSSV